MDNSWIIMVTSFAVPLGIVLSKPITKTIKKGKDTIKQLTKEHHVRDLSKQEQLRLLFDDIVKGNYILDDVSDKRVRFIEVKGFKGILKVMWVANGEKDTFLFGKELDKTWMYCHYHIKEEKISNINDQWSPFYTHLDKSLNVFEDEWTSHNIETMKEAVKTISAVCREGLEGVKVDKRKILGNQRKVNDYLNGVEEIPPTHMNRLTLPNSVLDVQKEINEVSKNLLRKELSIERKHVIVSLTQKAEELIDAFLKFPDHLQKSKQSALTESLQEVLSKLIKIKEKEDSNTLYEFEKLQRVVAEYDVLERK